MKRILCLILALGVVFAFCACSEKDGEIELPLSPMPTVEPTVQPTAEPTAEPASEPDSTGELPGLSLYTPTESTAWGALYRQWLENSFDVIAALWPEGISGIGFVDLDLDGTPELLLFDMGASAAMGVHIFDIAEGAVVCVSSVNEAAAAAFGGEYFSAVSVCAQLFEDFRLVTDGEQTYFTVHSANGTPEFSWEEDIRFQRGRGDVLAPESLCRRETANDVENDVIAVEDYFVAGETTDEVSYSEAQRAVSEAADLGYEAGGVFLWDDMERYDTSLEGLLVMLDDALALYMPIAG